jgi:hypothetical protein
MSDCPIERPLPTQKQTGNARITSALRRVRTTIVAVEEQKSITYSERVFLAFGTRNAMRMSHIVMWPARLYHIFPRYHISGANFE